MKKFKKISVAFLVAVFILSLSGLKIVSAATAPSLGLAASYGVLASTYTDTSAATTVNGDVGFSTPPATAIGGVHSNYGSGYPYAAAGIDQNSALATLALESCTFNFAAGAINLSTDTTHGQIGVYTPGVYCSDGAMDVGGALTLSGSGTYIFRAVGIPQGRNNAAWYNPGPRPGDIGNAIIVGHYGRWKNGSATVFNNLSKLRPGDKIYIKDGQGTTISFVVREKRSYSLRDDVTAVFVSSDGKSHLNLITCEGTWDKASQSYSRRLVVFADRE